MSGCKFSTYGSQCRSQFVNADGFCENHSKSECWCGSQAVGGCCHAGQFVCGRPLCVKHKNFCPLHGGDKPNPKCKSCGQDLPGE